MNKVKNEIEIEREKIITLHKGKKGALRIIFGRTAIVIVMLLLQILALFGIYTYLGQYSAFITVLYTILGFFLVVYIINQKDNPVIQITWIIAILTLPVFGSLLYLFIKFQIETRLMNRRLQKLAGKMRPYSLQNETVYKKLHEKDKQISNLASYAYTQGGFPVYENTSATYFSSGEDMFQELLVQLEQAEHFIFLEFFIIEEGYMWGRILEVLERKVKAGVEVRVLYDGFCSVALLPYNYPKQIKSLGIQCKMFSPIKPALSTLQNNRDHRKIVVIDGHTAFTGGVNLADEYINRKVRFGHWKDSAIMLNGDAVKSFTFLFLQMWNIRKRKENYSEYLTNIPFGPITESRGFVLPYGDSPLNHENIAESIYLDIINQARNYVHIMTPYLILDHELIHALTYAAKRGVDVTIIMPHIPDKRMIFALSKTYYRELIESGVSIYEYTPGFIHSKVFTSDDEKAVVGSINMDFRSLYLHFECAVYLYQVSEIGSIENDIQQTLQRCKKITLSDCKKEHLFTKAIGRLLRLFAPLM